MIRLIVPAALLFATSLAAAEVDYIADVKPLLVRKCSACHGPLKQEMGLRLDAGQLIHRGSDDAKVIIPGRSSESRIIEKVSAEDPALRMPPEGEGEPLTSEQIATLRTWIDAGAKFPDDETILPDPREHWAYQVPARPLVPDVDDSDWSSNPIDRFIAAKHREGEVTPLPEADRATLLRRLYLDLIGLPPTRDELHAFVEDESPTAYEEVVDRLLESPHYGERWGRHWMDVWRYSDWFGQGEWVHGSQRHVWRWRDWIIESLNSDRSYDQMIVEMLAGDEIAPEDPDTLRATAFLARNFFDGNRDVWLDATVEHTFKAFLGITLNCCKCHDHKYDPLVQSDYYQVRAIFEPHNVRIDRLPGQSDVVVEVRPGGRQVERLQDGLTRIYDADPAAETYLYKQGNEKLPDKTRPMEAALPAFFGDRLHTIPVELPQRAYLPDLQEFVLEENLAAARRDVQKAKSKLQDAEEAERPLLELKLAEARAALVSTEARIEADRARHGGTNESTYEERCRAARQAERLHAVAVAEVASMEAERKRTAAQQAVKEDDPKTKTALEKAEKSLTEARTKLDKAKQELDQSDGEYTPIVKEYPRTSTGRRLALARWIASGDNPLTARVAVNHIWLRHFGTPLVERVFDFGLNSPPPEHQQLLDWLAVELVEGGWRMKPLHRLMVTSRTYRLSSGEESVSSQPSAFSDQPSAISDQSSDNRASNIQHPTSLVEVRASTLNAQRSTLNAALDPENRLYWRANVRRLDAEVVRDSVLCVAGSLDKTVGGPDIDFNLGESVPRRSVYFQNAYEKQSPFLVVFDAANPADCYQRTASIIPQQALALSNSGFSLSQARRLARSLTRELEESGGGDEQFIAAAFEQTLIRAPWPEELAASREFLTEQQQLFADMSALTEFERGPSAEIDPNADPRLVRISRRTVAQFLAGETTAVEASRDPALRARENLVHVLMNHTDFVTVR
jgi:hypothetical protein